MRLSIFSKLFIAIIITALFSCADEKHFSEARIKDLYKNSKYLNDTAAFLAGMYISPESSLYPITQQNQYLVYKRCIDSLWNRYDRLKLKKIEKWRNKNLKGKKFVTIFYPFSGPDILNALAFFPNAREYIMIGLELPGNIPDPIHAKRSRVFSGLWKIKKALHTLLQLNLFRTREMQSDIRSDSFNSITGVMMFFLARYGYEILAVQKIYVGDHGVISKYMALKEKGVESGIELVFRKGRGFPIQRARFFSIDLSDRLLANLTAFPIYLKKKSKFTTFLKSASYLLSLSNFKILRKFILSRSNLIVQDDSGIPYNYFSKKEWDISFYGKYRVLEMFTNRFQPDLARIMKKRSLGRLPFSYGYGFIPEKSNLMVAERRSN